MNDTYSDYKYLQWRSLSSKCTGEAGANKKAEAGFGWLNQLGE
jgi:hypothetical protein